MEKLNDIVQKKSRELEESLKNANIENLSLKAKSTKDATNAKAEMYLSKNFGNFSIVSNCQNCVEGSKNNKLLFSSQLDYSVH